MKDEKKGLKKSELALIGLALIALVGGSYLYLSGFPLMDYLFGLNNGGGQKIAKLVRSDGTIRRQLKGDSDFREVNTGADLFNADTLVTSPNTSAHIEFNDGSYIDMAPSTMVRLTFGMQFSLAGVVRATSVQVISGNVTGESKSQNFVVNRGDSKVNLEAPKPSPKPVVSRAPIPPPTPTPEPSVSFVVVYPKSGSRLSVENGSAVAEVPITFAWQMTPNEPAVTFVLSQRSATSDKVLFTKDVAMASSDGQFPLAMKHPGSYRVEIQSWKHPGELLGATNFVVEPEYEAIRLDTAKVAGLQANSSKLQGKVVKNFDLSFSWEPYTPLKKYELYFYVHPGGKPIWQGTIDGTNYGVNQGKVFAGRIFYKVRGRLPNGFIVESPVQGFSFDFLPPIPVNPKDRTAFSRRALLKGDDQILITWEKTNFTSYYDLELASDPMFTHPIARQRTEENFFVVKDPQMGSYYWRVQSISGNDKSSGPSQVSSFAISP